MSLVGRRHRRRRLPTLSLRLLRFVLFHIIADKTGNLFVDFRFGSGFEKPRIAGLVLLLHQLRQELLVLGVHVLQIKGFISFNE